MDIRLLTTATDLEAYDAWVSANPQGSLWQSCAWLRYQKALGRKAHVYAANRSDGSIAASALVITDYTVMNLSTWDIPRGPIIAQEDGEGAEAALLRRIVADARKDKGLTLTCSPLAALRSSGIAWKHSPRHEQPEATRLVDLTLSNEDILKQMHQKGRYNIKVAEKNGVRIERSQDATAFGELLRRTAARDGFAAAPVHHYETFLKALEGAFLLLAYVEGTATPIAGLMGAQWNGTCIYYYGASDYEHRALMAPYLLQWEAMKIGKAAGCARYDLLGVAPPDASEDHPWQGISRFKEKFGGTVVTYPPEQRIVLKPVVHAALGLKRKIMG
jgi:peptidoglycan pentaglycine glycine transferase (the first glycine)